jgi:hypothetical protein
VAFSKNALFALLALLGATPAIAMEVDTDGDRLVPREASHLDTTSRGERRHQHIEALLGTYGYGLGAFLGDDTIMEVGYTGLEEDEDRQEWSHGGFVHAKLFRGNSFYGVLGVSGRERGPLATPMRGATREQALADFAIGNQWQWRHFTLGCDWVGVSVPFYTQVTESDASVIAGDHDRIFASTRSPEAPDWHVLRLYAGVTF